MASHVVVIAASARRHTVKTTPGKYLTEVLQEACQKFGLDSDQYSLKWVRMFEPFIDYQSFTNK